MNVLKNKNSFLHITKSEFSKVNIIPSVQKVGERCGGDDLKCAWGRVPCWLSNGTVKRHFLDTESNRLFASP